MCGAYASPSEVRPLLGNLKNQISDSTINLASDGAESQINRVTARSTNWTSSDPDYNAIKKVGRLLTAAECLYGINGMEQTRSAMVDEANAILQAIMKFDTGVDSGDFVESSQPSTYPSNPQGIIFGSARFPMLRKYNQDSRQYDSFYDNPP